MPRPARPFSPVNFPDCAACSLPWFGSLGFPRFYQLPDLSRTGIMQNPAVFTGIISVKQCQATFPGRKSDFPTLCNVQLTLVWGFGGFPALPTTRPVQDGKYTESRGCGSHFNFRKSHGLLR